MNSAIMFAVRSMYGVTMAVHPLKIFSRQIAVTTVPSKWYNFVSSSKKKAAANPLREKEPLMMRIARKFGWSETSKSMLLMYGHLLMVKIADEIKYENFFKVCDMDDTYHSWFTVTELHVWLLCARLSEFGQEGMKVRHSLVTALWDHNEQKSKMLEGALQKARRQQIQELNQGFYYALVSYDEGLQGDDKILASALWNKFLKEKKPRNEKELLRQIVAVEMLVIYVRYQYKLLKSLSPEKIYRPKNFQWVPFNEQLLGVADSLRHSSKLL